MDRKTYAKEIRPFDVSYIGFAIVIALACYIFSIEFEETAFVGCSLLGSGMLVFMSRYNKQIGLFQKSKSSALESFELFFVKLCSIGSFVVSSVGLTIPFSIACALFIR